MSELDWSIGAGDPVDAADRADPSLFFSPGERSSDPFGIIACTENASLTSRRASRRYIRMTALIPATGIALLLGSSAARFERSGGLTGVPEARQATVTGAPIANLPPPNLLRPLSPEEAAKENTDRPFVHRPDTAASRFVLRTGADDKERALTCLAQAVYYEAGGEGADGGRAVAQVVLNRVRHPGYPTSICGVVYQGSDRPTGCQFTFTCNGSLLRTPEPSLWTRSRKIAEEALSGKVFAPIGHATSYHADYVLPYWADSLDKMVQIGRHIFYRLRGTYGDRGSFFQHYAGVEPQLPDPRAVVTLPPSSATAQLASDLLSDSVNGAPSEVEKVAQPASPLAIDSSQGILIADPAGSAGTHRRRPSAECQVPAEGKQLSPLSATNMHSDAAAPGC